MKLSAASLRSDLVRFGLAPSKWGARLRPRLDLPVVANSIPKSGTHLLESVLVAHPALYRVLRPTLYDGKVMKMPGGLKPVLDSAPGGGLLITHLPWSEEWEQQIRTRGCPSLLCIRDPRDIAISASYYMLKNQAHPFHPLFKSCTDAKERIRLSITGNADAGFPPLRYRVERYLPWLDTQCLVVRFEDLVGAAGGGDDAVQEKTLAGLFDLLKLDGVDEVLQKIRIPSSRLRSPTFRKGKIQQWKEEFDQELHALFDEHAGGLPEQMGYPPSPK